jgi:predicted N-formylglutamate amidohydrolase
LDATLVASSYSRLVVDLNRPLGSPDLIPEIADDTPIPGNFNLSRADRSARISALFDPYHQRISSVLDARSAVRVPTFLLALHSFTPELSGARRPWHIGTANGRHRHMASLLLDELRADGDVVVGDNLPYAISIEADYGIPVHGDDRGLPNVMVEIRQDLIADQKGAEAWAERLADCLDAIASRLEALSSCGVPGR